MEERETISENSKEVLVQDDLSANSNETKKGILVGVVNAADIKCTKSRKRRWDQAPGEDEGSPEKHQCLHDNGPASNDEEAIINSKEGNGNSNISFEANAENYESGSDLKAIIPPLQAVDVQGYSDLNDLPVNEGLAVEIEAVNPDIVSFPEGENGATNGDGLSSDSKFSVVDVPVDLEDSEGRGDTLDGTVKESTGDRDTHSVMEVILGKNLNDDHISDDEPDPMQAKEEPGLKLVDYESSNENDNSPSGEVDSPENIEMLDKEIKHDPLDNIVQANSESMGTVKKIDLPHIDQSVELVDKGIDQPEISSPPKAELSLEVTAEIPSSSLSSADESNGKSDSVPKEECLVDELQNTTSIDTDDPGASTSKEIPAAEDIPGSRDCLPSVDSSSQVSGPSSVSVDAVCSGLEEKSELEDSHMLELNEKLNNASAAENHNRRSEVISLQDSSNTSIIDKEESSQSIDSDVKDVDPEAIDVIHSESKDIIDSDVQQVNEEFKDTLNSETKDLATELRDDLGCANLIESNTVDSDVKEFINSDGKDVIISELQDTNNSVLKGVIDSEVGKDNLVGKSEDPVHSDIKGSVDLEEEDVRDTKINDNCEVVEGTDDSVSKDPVELAVKDDDSEPIHETDSEMKDPMNLEVKVPSELTEKDHPKATDAMDAEKKVIIDSDMKSPIDSVSKEVTAVMEVSSEIVADAEIVEEGDPLGETNEMMTKGMSSFEDPVMSAKDHSKDSDSTPGFHEESPIINVRETPAIAKNISQNLEEKSLDDDLGSINIEGNKSGLDSSVDIVKMSADNEDPSQSSRDNESINISPSPTSPVISKISGSNISEESSENNNISEPAVNIVDFSPNKEQLPQSQPINKNIVSETSKVPQEASSSIVSKECVDDSVLSKTPVTTFASPEIDEKLISVADGKVEPVKELSVENKEIEDKKLSVKKSDKMVSITKVLEDNDLKIEDSENSSTQIAKKHPYFPEKEDPTFNSSEVVSGDNPSLMMECESDSNSESFESVKSDSNQRSIEINRKLLEKFKESSSEPAVELMETEEILPLESNESLVIEISEPSSRQSEDDSVVDTNTSLMSYIDVQSEEVVDQVSQPVRKVGVKSETPNKNIPLHIDELPKTGKVRNNNTSPSKTSLVEGTQSLSKLVSQPQSKEKIVPLLKTVNSSPVVIKKDPEVAPIPSVPVGKVAVPPKMDPITLRIFKDNHLLNAEGTESPKTKSPKSESPSAQSPHGKQLEFTLKISKDATSNVPKATMSPKGSPSGVSKTDIDNIPDVHTPSPEKAKIPQPRKNVWVSEMKEAVVSVERVSAIPTHTSAILSPPSEKAKLITPKSKKSIWSVDVKEEIKVKEEIDLLKRALTPSIMLSDIKNESSSGFESSQSEPVPDDRSNDSVISTTRKRGRPRKTLLARALEGSPLRSPVMSSLSSPELVDSSSDSPLGRPKRECRDRTKRIFVKTRKPRGGVGVNMGSRGGPSGRGRGGSRVPILPSREALSAKEREELAKIEARKEAMRLEKLAKRDAKIAKKALKPSPPSPPPLTEEERIELIRKKKEEEAKARAEAAAREEADRIRREQERIAAEAAAEAQRIAKEEERAAKLAARRLKLMSDYKAKRDAKLAKKALKKLKDEERRKRKAAEKAAERAAEQAALQNMYEDETRMSAPDGSLRPLFLGEESQSSTHNRKGRMEIAIDTDAKDLAVEQLAEYQWDGSELYMIQEQVAEYLGVKSFKRKYPELRRRAVDAEERTFLESSGLVPKPICDLGITAVPSSEILDIMYQDFPDKYEEVRKYLREKQMKEISEKQKALSIMNKLNDKAKADMREQAVDSASGWNTQLNRDRRASRQCSMDLQSFIMHYPESRRKSMQVPVQGPGDFPIAVLSGQYCHYYKKYTSNELMYYPINTVLYGPMRPNEQQRVTSEASDTSSESSSSDESSSSESDSEFDDSVPKCKLCSAGHRMKGSQKDPFIQCTKCKHLCHFSCCGLSLALIPQIRKYRWHCPSCKSCPKCIASPNPEKIGICDVCDKG